MSLSRWCLPGASVAASVDELFAELSIRHAGMIAPAIQAHDSTFTSVSDAV